MIIYGEQRPDYHPITQGNTYYPGIKAKIFILSCNAEIRKYEVQQIDIGILF
jgi:hypothetical protein